MPPPLSGDQRAFCEAQGSGVRLLAPAGCGKTHALPWRCLHLATNGGKESPRFLLFTFTRAARDELRDRLRNDPAFRSVAPLVNITSLNSWGFRRLKASRHSLQLRSVLRRLHDLELVRDQAKRVNELLKHFVRFWCEASERMVQSANPSPYLAEMGLIAS